MDYVNTFEAGGTKRDAKHLAAANVIKQIRLDDASMHVVPESDNDMVMALRDYCVQKNHPLPKLEVVQQGGTPDAQEFVTQCKLASITRFGVSNEKEDSCQKAACEMLRVIVDNSEQLESDLSKATADMESERYRKFKTYRELTQNKADALPGIKLCDRHNYFKNFYEPLKAAALAILHDESYESSESMVVDALAALKLTYKKEVYRNLLNLCDPLLFISLDCEYDACFLAPSSEIYGRIVTYFRVMLT